MYINSIDNLIDSIINDFSIKLLFNKKSNDYITFSKIINEVNFVKYQKEINDIVLNYNKKIRKLDITSIVSNKQDY